MDSAAIKAGTVDEYITNFPKQVQELLESLRTTIKKSASHAAEVISYNMPAYKYHGMLVYFAGYKNHIGFYATPAGNNKFKSELSRYKQGKGSVQFPLNEEIPLDLIFQIIKFKVEDNTQK